MNMKTELYTDALTRLPQQGKHIIGYQEEEHIVVYQAYKPAIADFAVKHQVLGGNSFSYERMSWIKPGFLWMMFRCGWAAKAYQERVLALWLKKEDFRKILEEAVPSTFKPKLYADSNSWKADMKQKEVRLQWDPDHSPSGHKLERRAIQLGLKGDVLATFGRQYVQKIEDITPFVSQQKSLLDQGQKQELQIPFESVMELADPELSKILGL